MVRTGEGGRGRGRGPVARRRLLSTRRHSGTAARAGTTSKGKPRKKRQSQTAYQGEHDHIESIALGTFSFVSSRPRLGVESLEDRVRGGDLDVRGSVLDKEGSHLVVLNDGGVALGAVAAKETSSVEAKADGVREGSIVVGEEVKVLVVGAKLLLPRGHGKLVVDTHDVDVLDALLLELLDVRDVARNLL